MSPAFNPKIWHGWAPVGDTLQRMTKDGILVTVEQHPSLQGFQAHWENVPKGTGYIVTARYELTLRSGLDEHRDLSQGWVA